MLERARMTPEKGQIRQHSFEINLFDKKVLKKLKIALEKDETYPKCFKNASLRLNETFAHLQKRKRKMYI